MTDPSKLIDAFAPAIGPPPNTLMAFMRWGFKGSFRYIALGGFVSALGGVIEVMSALILGLVIDAALVSSADTFFSSNMMLLLGVAAFFVLLRPIVFGLSGLMQSVVLAPAIMNMIYSRLHRHTLGQSVQFFDDDFAGRIAQKQGQAARAATDLVIETIHTVIFAAASLIGSVMLMFTIDGRSALLLALWVVAYVLLIRFFMPRVRAASKKRASSRAMVTGQVVDTVTNIKTVKLFAHDQFEDRAAIDAMETMRQASVGFGILSANFRFLLMTLAGLLPLIMVGATLYFWTSGSASAGDIAVSGTIGLRLAQMTGWVSFTLLGMYANVGEVEDAIRTLSPAHTLVDAVDAKELIVTEAEIKFEDVSFKYGGGQGGLNGVHLTVHSGEKLGIVGASGAGKSTLVSLLLRIYDTEDGAIMIDGQDLRGVTQESLRRQIGMVQQDSSLLHRSVRDNIRYGRQNATQAEILAASKQAVAHDFIVDLKDLDGNSGYEALVGERGVKLSGGERQRISLARVILKNAPILLLDEATSALDSEIEAEILNTLYGMMQGKTVIAIAHRLSTIARMDRIIVMDNGSIVENGPHEALLAQNGQYATFWARQSGGFIDIKAVI